MTHAISHWGYLALFILCTVSSLGIPLGTEVAIGYGGALSSGHLSHKLYLHFNLPTVIAVAAAGEIVGSLLAYSLARFGGREFLHRRKRRQLRGWDLDRAEALCVRYGASIVVFGRFVPVIRSFISFAPGLAKMPAVRFVVCTVIGCAMWCAALASLGFELGRTWHHVFQRLEIGGIALLGLIALVPVALVSRRILSTRREQAIS